VQVPVPLVYRILPNAPWSPVHGCLLDMDRPAPEFCEAGRGRPSGSGLARVLSCTAHSPKSAGDYTFWARPFTPAKPDSAIPHLLVRSLWLHVSFFGW